MAATSRPESSELDQKQMAELRNFFSRRTPGQLRKDLEQTIKDAEDDQRPSASGGTPANATKAFIAIKDALESKELE